MFFLTDGTASYPTNSIELFKMNPSIMRKITFYAVGFTGENQPGDFPVLKQMA